MSDTLTPASRDDADEPSEDYYYCDERECDASLEGMDFVYGLCPQHRSAERYYLCQTYKSGRIDVLDGDGFDEFSPAYIAACKPRGSFPSGDFWILPGVCASRRALETGEGVPPGDASVRVIVRTQGCRG